MNIEEIKMDHFENFEELIKTCKMWIREDDIDAYYRFFEFNCMKALVTAYEKEKGENVKLRLQDIPLIEGELKAYKDRVNELKSELEKEKEKNKSQPDCAEPAERTEEMVNMRWVNYNYIGKEKLKARIEEYENKIKKIRSKKLINEPEDTINITRYVHYISVLQSLLEKE